MTATFRTSYGKSDTGEMTNRGMGRGIPSSKMKNSNPNAHLWANENRGVVEGLRTVSHVCFLIHPYVMWIHPHVMCIHRYVIWIHPYVMWIHPYVMWIHRYVMWIHRYVIWIHPYVMWIHPHVMWILLFLVFLPCFGSVCSFIVVLFVVLL
jgi:hypothetical protein